jgi:SecD/SecF fusion protein
MKLETVLYYISAIFAVALILFIFIIIKFKARGFISMYLQIGFFAVLLLIIRLTNVTLTMEGIAGLIIAAILNYVFNYIMLKRVKEPGMYKETNLSFMFYTLPVFIVSIIFTFSTKAILSSFGMTIFWGIIITYVYNFIFSKYVFENLTGGKKDENSKNNN